MSIARIANDQIEEQRDDITLEDVPPHKRSQWKLITGDPPTYDPVTQYLTGPTYVIGASEVTRSWVINNKVFTAQDVKAEAQRRIIVLMGARDITDCIVKELNASMRATELVNIKAQGGTLTAEQQAEEAALQALADDIKYIRAKSNEIEGMSPIPSDYTSNAYWA